MRTQFRFTCRLAVLAGLVVSIVPGFAAPPTGEYAELHACEVYTGGCTASAQSTTGGRSVLRVWKFATGNVGTTPVEGLPLVVLEVADANLALPDTKAKESLAYLPAQATELQRQALLDFLKSAGVSVTDSRVVSVRYQRNAGCLTVQAGDEVEFTTREIEKCDSGSCGEQLWYSPRGATGPFTVLVNDHSRVKETKFQLVWRDNSAKSVFFGRFGGPGKPEFSLASIP